MLGTFSSDIISTVLGVPSADIVAQFSLLVEDVGAGYSKEGELSAAERGGVVDSGSSGGSP